MDDLTANALCVGGDYDGYVTEVISAAYITFTGLTTFDLDDDDEVIRYRFAGEENGVRIYRWEP